MVLTYTLRIVLLGASLLGAVAGALGCFALLRRQSLLGDALAHAALPGVCLAFLWTGSKQPLPLLAGALVAGIIGAIFIMTVVRSSRIKQDAAMGIVLSVFFGAGVVLLTRIQNLPTGNQAGLNTFLFGQAATLLAADVQVMAIMAAVVLLVVVLLYKEFKILTFDQAFAASLGRPVRLLEIVLTGLIVVVVMVGLQMVGVVLMVATLITPAAAARQWTSRLGVMVLIAAVVGASSGALGALASASIDKLPTGPVIVLVMSAVLAVSLLIAPSRGMLWQAIAEFRMRRRIRRENLLKDLYTLGERRAGGDRFYPLEVVAEQRGQQPAEVAHLVSPLARNGLVALREQAIGLTPEGEREAERVVRKHRLWEVYLTRRLDLPSDHVHRDADAMEHALSDQTIDEIDALLGHPKVDPHGRTIPPRREP